MKVIRTIPHERYNCEQVAEIFDSGFCERVRWTKESNYKPHPGESAYILDDETPVEVGWRMRDGNPIAPDAEVLEDLKADKKLEIAAARFAAETGGMDVSGMRIDTSRESQGLITGAAVQAMVDGSYTCNWKTGAGFVTLDAETIMAVATAVRQHVQACFDKEAKLMAELDAANTVQKVQAVVWV